MGNTERCRKYRIQKKKKETQLKENALGLSKLKAECEDLKKQIQWIENKYKTRIHEHKAKYKKIEHEYRLYKLYHSKCVYDR